MQVPLLSATLQGVGRANPLYGAGSTGTWPQYGSDEGFSFGSPYGPTGPYLLYSYTAPNSIIPAPVVSGGYVAFAAGNKLYELNASTGAAAKNYPVANNNPIAGAPVFYKNSLIYANSTGYVTAISTSNGLARLWSTEYRRTAKLTAPLDVEDGYLVVGTSNATGYGKIYFLDPSNGTVVESDPTSINGNGAVVLWIAHHKGAYYVGVGAGKLFNETLRRQYVNASGYPSNSFASYGNFAVVKQGAAAAMYANTTAYYSKASGLLNLTSVPYYTYAHSSPFTLGVAGYNTTPSIGGNTTYILSNGINFEAFRQTGQRFNVTLPNAQFAYNYSDIALAYGNAYLANGKSLYVFGVGGMLQRNSSLLSALGTLYLNGRGGLADYVLYSTYGFTNIGIFINGSYAPGLHVAKFNGVDSYISVPARPKLSPQALTGGISVCGWYRINGNSIAAYNGLLYKGAEYSVGSGGGRGGFTVFGSSGGTIAATYNVPLTSNVLGKWYSFCFAYNGSSANYYLNGTQYAVTVGANGVAAASSSPLIIGAGSASGYSNVSVANLQLYNSVLPASRVGGIYSSGIFGGPSNSSNLVGWWPLLGDGNDYGGGSLVGFPNNMVYTSASYIPISLTRAVQVGGSALPLQLIGSGGVTGVYNVSVVVWSN